MSSAQLAWLDAVVIVAVLISGFALFFASLPVPGALIMFYGGKKSTQETEKAGRRRRIWRWTGFLLMVGGSAFQILRLIGPLR